MYGRPIRPHKPIRGQPPANEDRKSAIVTIRSRRHAKYADVPDITEEVDKRRGEAATAMWREEMRRLRLREI